jgi:hypothetical protein
MVENNNSIDKYIEKNNKIHKYTKNNNDNNNKNLNKYNEKVIENWIGNNYFFFEGKVYAR